MKDLSAKVKRAKSAPKKESKPARQEIKKPAGKVPGATVSARHGIVMIQRSGKGFSMGELASVGLPMKLAGRWGVPRDFRRRSILEPNVQSLKKWSAGSHRRSEAPAPAPALQPAAEEKPVKKRAARKKKTEE
jgi:ribosomal protein L13E